MKRGERIEDLNTALLKAMQGNQAGLWTGLPCIIESFDPIKQTCTAQPAIMGRVQSRDGNPPQPGAVLDVAPWWWVKLPLLVDVPVEFPSGGGFSLTFPIKQGDEAFVKFSSRCIDSWWQSGDVGVQAEFRMHDLSDGVAFVGIKSVPNAISNISNDSTQLRSDDGQTFVEVKDGTLKLKAPTSVMIDSPLTTMTGDLVVLGSATITALLSYLAGLSGVGGSSGSVITGDLTQTGGSLTSNGTNLHTHVHSGVTPGGANTNGPV